SGTLEMLRDGRNVSATFAMSLTMGILDYRVTAAGMAGIDGTWNIACSNSELQPFDQTCRNPLPPRNCGCERCYQLMRTAGFATFGWAMYDVDLEDHNTACVKKAQNEASVNRIVQVKQLLKNMATSKAPAE
ncbi:hypothetical protein MTO96_046686, partial [Rhipicephalus appendiculatus]